MILILLVTKKTMITIRFFFLRLIYLYCGFIVVVVVVVVAAAAAAAATAVMVAVIFDAAVFVDIPIIIVFLGHLLKRIYSLTTRAIKKRDSLSICP